MKKTFMTAAAVLSLSVSSLFAPGVEAEAASKPNYISTTKAKQLALKEVYGKIVDLDFERHKLNPHYEIEIRTAKEEVELKVDAISGDVTITDRDPLKKNLNKGKKHKLNKKDRSMEFAKAKHNHKGHMKYKGLSRDHKKR